MIFQPMTSHHSVLLCILYISLEAGGFIYQKRITHGRSDGKRSNTPYRPLFFCAMAVLYSVMGIPSATRSAPTTPAESSCQHTNRETEALHGPATAIEPRSLFPSAIHAIPASSFGMVPSLSNLSSIGLCAAPPLRIRQRSRTIETVIACTSIPVSSLAMMSSLSNLSSIGMCTAPPLRTRHRSRTATSPAIVGYASAVPFVSSKKVSTAA